MERVYRETEIPWEAESDLSSGTWGWWATGNNSCDCNRALYFKRAAGESTDDDETPCGDQVLYRVPYVTLSDGTRVYIDD